MLQRLSRGFVLRKSQGKLGGFDQLSLTGRGFTNDAVGGFGLGFFVGCCLILALAFVAVLFAHPELRATASTSLGLGTAAKLAFPALLVPKKGGTEKKPAKIREMEGNLKQLAKELEAGQLEMSQGPVTQERGEELEEKAQEMTELQEQLDRYNKIAGIVKRSHEVERVTLPGEEHGNVKRLYTTPGHMFVMSNALGLYKQQGKQGWSAKVDLGRQFGKKILLSGEQAAEFEKKVFDAGDLPGLGTDAIIPYDRDPEIVRFAEPEILTIRNMLNVVPTTSDAIRYVRHSALTRAAASQATRGAAKNYLKTTYEAVTTSVETIAVLSKVTEQDIDDAPRLVGFINGEMTLDVKVEEERQIAWGDGTNGQLLGLFDPTNALPEFNRAAGGDTIIDTIRKMRTDLRKSRVQPNFVAIDPIDWEEVELAKGSTNYYIWGLVSDLRGPRIWSLQVIESDAMTNLETNERRVLMGDGQRGATIYDRSATQLAVGFVDDDFARNLRTLRAEERLALAVKRNFAFEYFVTSEAAS